MKTFYRKIKNWCNANQGLINLFTLLIAIIALVPFQKIDFTIAKNGFLDKIFAILIYRAQIPVYLLIIMSVAIVIYMLKFKRKYKIHSTLVNLFSGTWKNEWGTTGNGGSEIMKITEDAKYLINEQHYFNIENFQYDPSKGQIQFTKVAVSPNDTRRLLNILNIKNNELLVGTEENYPIRYSKISN